VRLQVGLVTLYLVLRHVLAGLVLIGLSAAMLYKMFAPVRDIWHGNARRVPKLSQISVNARSYLAFLLWFTPVFSGLALLGLTLTIGIFFRSMTLVAPLVVTGVILMLGGLPLIPLHWFVSAFSRPQFLIPPPYRSDPGGISQARERRRRRRSGEPPTDHLVEILDVRPSASDDGFEPYLMARCDDPDCDWMAFPDDKLIGVADEDQLRNKAARHTTKIASQVIRPLG
jgi:hypothetical protein